MYLDIHLNVVYIGSYGSSLFFWLLSAPRNDYINEDLPDEDETDASVRAPASLLQGFRHRVLLPIRVTPFLRLGNLWQAGIFTT